MQTNKKAPVLKTATVELLRLQNKKNLKKARLSRPDLILAGQLLVKTIDGDNMLNY